MRSEWRIGLRAPLRFTLAALLLFFGTSSWPEPLPASGESAPQTPAVSPDGSGSGTAVDPIDATGSELSGSFGMTFGSRYLFQGVDQCDGSCVVQPELQMEHGNLSLSLWINHQISGNRVTEIDGGAQYTLARGIASLSLGYLYLNYRDAGGIIGQEVVVEIGLDTLLEPGLSLHEDFGAGDGLYATAEISQSLAIFPLRVALEGYYQRGYFGQSGFPGGMLSFVYAGTHGGIAFEPRIAYAGGWRNHDFRGESSVPGTWLLSLTTSRAF